MADLEKTISRAVILVPVAHIIVCTLYIAGYSLGFGGNIGGLYSPVDFFTVTLQHLIYIYVLSLAMPILFILFRHRSGRTYASDEIAAETDPEKKVALAQTASRVVSFFDYALPMFLVLVLVSFSVSIYVDTYIQYYLTFNAIVLSLYPTFIRLAEWLNFRGLRVEVAWSLISFTAAVVGLGLDSGQIDRRLTYDALAKGAMRCQGHVILTPIGQRFLSVTRDNRRHVVDADCKARFEFEQRPLWRGGPLPSLFLEKIRARAAPAAPGSRSH